MGATTPDEARRQLSELHLKLNRLGQDTRTGRTFKTCEAEDAKQTLYLLANRVKLIQGNSDDND